MSNDQEILDDLIFFSRSGDFEELKQVNAQPELFITKNDVGNTALHMASANNHVDIVEYIIQQLKQWKPEEMRSLVNTTNEQGNTALHWAALNGHLAVVELLLKNKADKTPIYEAQQHGHEKVAEHFLLTMIEEEPEEPVDEENQFVEKGYDQQNQ
ncbi:ankyrin repeat-containing domain protein [Syncephalastrum racemosum]|uniref:Ankyrin repeat-containing domain protein n=1 Tax=Syncephalastrum racemosum TaxID=13706 RepID=A0A1X2HI64_SYNRA|nr:ankyrin repeat-containing domain protein [Syncephalastrum racemosum]